MMSDGNDGKFSSFAGLDREARRAAFMQMYPKGMSRMVRLQRWSQDDEAFWTKASEQQCKANLSFRDIVHTCYLGSLVQYPVSPARDMWNFFSEEIDALLMKSRELSCFSEEVSAFGHDRAIARLCARQPERYQGQAPNPPSVVPPHVPSTTPVPHVAAPAGACDTGQSRERNFSCTSCDLFFRTTKKYEDCYQCDYSKCNNIMCDECHLIHWLCLPCRKWKDSQSTTAAAVVSPPTVPVTVEVSGGSSRIGGQSERESAVKAAPTRPPPKVPQVPQVSQKKVQGPPPMAAAPSPPPANVDRQAVPSSGDVSDEIWTRPKHLAGVTWGYMPDGSFVSKEGLVSAGPPLPDVVETVLEDGHLLDRRGDLPVDIWHQFQQCDSGNMAQSLVVVPPLSDMIAHHAQWSPQEMNFGFNAASMSLPPALGRASLPGAPETFSLSLVIARWAIFSWLNVVVQRLRKLDTMDDDLVFSFLVNKVLPILLTFENPVGFRLPGQVNPHRWAVAFLPLPQIVLFVQPAGANWGWTVVRDPVATQVFFADPLLKLKQVGFAHNEFFDLNYLRQYFMNNNARERVDPAGVPRWIDFRPDPIAPFVPSEVDPQRSINVRINTVPQLNFSAFYGIDPPVANVFGRFPVGEFSRISFRGMPERTTSVSLARYAFVALLFGTGVDGVASEKYIGQALSLGISLQEKYIGKCWNYASRILMVTPEVYRQSNGETIAMLRNFWSILICRKVPTHEGWLFRAGQVDQDTRKRVLVPIKPHENPLFRLWSLALAQYDKVVYLELDTLPSFDVAAEQAERVFGVRKDSNNKVRPFSAGELVQDLFECSISPAALVTKQDSSYAPWSLIPSQELYLPHDPTAWGSCLNGGVLVFSPSAALWAEAAKIMSQAPLRPHGGQGGFDMLAFSAVFQDTFHALPMKYNVVLPRVLSHNGHRMEILKAQGADGISVFSPNIIHMVGQDNDLPAFSVPDSILHNKLWKLGLLIQEDFTGGEDFIWRFKRVRGIECETFELGYFRGYDSDSRRPEFVYNFRDSKKVAKYQNPLFKITCCLWAACDRIFLAHQAYASESSFLGSALQDAFPLICSHTVTRDDGIMYRSPGANRYDNMGCDLLAMGLAGTVTSGYAICWKYNHGIKFRCAVRRRPSPDVPSDVHECTLGLHVCCCRACIIKGKDSWRAISHAYMRGSCDK